MFHVINDYGNTLEFLADAPDEIQHGRSSGCYLLLVGYSIIGPIDREPYFLVLYPAEPIGRIGKDTAALTRCFRRVRLACMRGIPGFGDETSRWSSEWAENSA